MQTMMKLEMFLKQLQTIGYPRQSSEVHGGISPKQYQKIAIQEVKEWQGR